MNKTIQSLMALTAFPFLLTSNSCASPQHEPKDTISITESVDSPLAYSCPTVPVSMEFCGKEIDLSRFDRYERMDREMLAFTYMHSTSLQMLKRANRYFPVIESILKECSIPDDFKYLMVIESNLNPTARSTAGAAGLWQFMPATGRDYGLEVNANVDERYHIEKATRAACRYLKDAYTKYGDWVAVAASYNAGQARIANQLKQQQVDDSLDLQLVEETARYVYRILAAKRLFACPADFGFRLRPTDFYPPIPCKELTVTTGIADLTAYARNQGITLALLKLLNPWLRESSLANKSGKKYVLLIPTAEGMRYDPKQTTVHDPRWVAE